MENQFIHTRGMICQSEAKEKTLAVTLSDADINGRKKKLLLYMEKDAPVAVGDDIEVRGILEKPERASNPGQFDGASYYRSKGIAYIMRPDGYTIVGKGNSYPALLDKIKTGDESAFDILAKEYEGLTEAAVKRFLPSFDIRNGENPVFGEEDLRQCAALALFKAAQTYDEGKEVSFGI